MGGALPSGTLSFGDGVGSQAVTIQVVGDTQVENDEDLDELEEYSLAPDSDEERAAREASSRRRLDNTFEAGTRFSPVEPVEQVEGYSIRDVFALTLVAAVLFAVSRFLDPEVFAGALGIMALLGLVVLSVLKPQKSILHVGWWVLLSLYLLSAIVAATRVSQ